MDTMGSHREWMDATHARERTLTPSTLPGTCPAVLPPGTASPAAGLLLLSMTSHAQALLGSGAGLHRSSGRRGLSAWRVAFLAPGQRAAPHSARVAGPGQASRQAPSAPRAMLGGLGSIFAADPAEKTRKKYADRVAAITALEPQMQRMSNDELRAKTQEFQQRAQGGESLDSILVEAFAVRPAGWGDRSGFCVWWRRAGGCFWRWGGRGRGVLCKAA